MSKRSVSEQERLELATKLDKELDEFIDNLPRRQKQETSPYNRWEEEIANHPFFMKEIPEAGSELHPLYEGLQKLKYDPEENEPEELALAYKDDGNFNFKHKKYRMAIISYTEGLKANCGNADIEATLYNNRSAAHYFLKNYRSALLDAETSLKRKPDYDKVLMRVANCCYKMEKYDKAVEFCDRILDKDKNNKEVLALRKNCVNEAKVKERNWRKREIEKKRIKQEEENIIGKIKSRGVRIEGGAENLTLSKLEPQFPQLFNSRVTVNENNCLVWPVIFFYPEYKIMDYIQQFEETDVFLDQLTQVFETHPEWDRDRKYKVGNLSVYFEDERNRNVKIDVSKTLLEILKLDGHLIKEGTPKFIILVANTSVEKLFLGHS